MDAMELYELVKQDENDLEIYLEDCPEVLTKIDKNQRSLLHWTVLSGRDRLFDFVFKQLQAQNKLKKFINMEDDTQATPIILATLGGNASIVKALLEQGANINHQNWQGHSALQYACSKGKKDIVGLLLEKNADVNILDKRKDSCLHRLASTGRDDIMDLMLKQNHLKVLDAQNSEGNTALHIGCEDDNVACVNLLINAGADYKLENKEKKTLFDLCKIPLRRQLIEKLNLGTD